MVKFWVGVASSNHVDLAVTDGFCQVCHGKGGPLRRMAKGDYLLYYSPKLDMTKPDKLQAFTAVGKMVDDEVYEIEQFPGFVPFRRQVRYYQPVQPCFLDRVRQHPEWPDYAGKIRYGHFEVSKDFFMYVFNLMRVTEND